MKSRFSRSRLLLQSGLRSQPRLCREQFPDQQSFAAAVQEYAATENAYKGALDEKIREAVQLRAITTRRRWLNT
jgi:hypothetical protein